MPYVKGYGKDSNMKKNKKMMGMGKVLKSKERCKECIQKMEMASATKPAPTRRKIR